MQDLIHVYLLNSFAEAFFSVCNGLIVKNILGCNYSKIAICMVGSHLRALLAVFLLKLLLSTVSVKRIKELASSYDTISPIGHARSSSKQHPATTQIRIARHQNQTGKHTERAICLEVYPGQ